MNEEQLQWIENNWIPALTSGQYEQAKGKLRDNNNYCCLGVACTIREEVAWQEFKNDWTVVDTTTNETSYSVVPDTLGEKIGLWEGVVLPVYEGSVENGEWFDVGSFMVKADEYENGLWGINLSSYNDIGFTFEQIADIIQSAVTSWR